MKINHLIDHTLLKPDSTIPEIIKIIDEAKKYSFHSVCINPYFVSLAKENLVDSQVKICTVIGFPLGANTIKTKTLEALESIENGANELDMVINIGALKNKNYNHVLKDIASVVEVAKGKALVKVIIETFLLTKEEKITACKIAKEAKANFVKTSTGFNGGGATLEDIKLMREVVGIEMGVKASGGIKTMEDIIKLIEAGASRIGTSSTVKILGGETTNKSVY